MQVNSSKYSKINLKLVNNLTKNSIIQLGVLLEKQSKRAHVTFGL